MKGITTDKAPKALHAPGEAAWHLPKVVQPPSRGFLGVGFGFRLSGFRLFWFRDLGFRALGFGLQDVPRSAGAPVRVLCASTVCLKGSGGD